MIKLEGIRVEYRNFSLKDISLDVDNGDYFMLVGPTGAGKTILLETIAGLHSLKHGTIRFDGGDITKIEPEKRGTGIVYQDYSLFPHLSVADNIIFGLKVRRTANSEIKRRLAEAAALVKVGHLLERKPGKLSGGEKQKVALARALIVRPRLLLLDEPLGALDPETRDELQQELKRIHRELGITIIHVTHDFDEALTLGKHMAVIGGGSIRQVGSPEEVFRKPNSIFVANFTMMRNIFPGKVTISNTGSSIFQTGDIQLTTSTLNTLADHACILPDDISLSTEITGGKAPNSFTGIVATAEERGTGFYVTADVPPGFCCLLTRRNFYDMRLRVGQKVNITFSANAVHTF